MGLLYHIRRVAFRVTGCACVLACAVSCGGKDGSTSSDTGGENLADVLLPAHNQVRGAVTQPANYTDTWAPLPALAWSAALETSAQTWANYLRDSKNCEPLNDDTSAFGENVAGGTVGFTALGAFNLWAAEKSAYVYNPVYAFDNNTGHYTQIVWRSTSAVGCAMARCASGYLVHVCHYDPAGNVVNGRPY